MKEKRREERCVVAGRQEETKKRRSDEEEREMRAETEAVQMEITGSPFYHRSLSSPKTHV